MHRRLLAAALILFLFTAGARPAHAADGAVSVTDANGFQPALVTINAGESVTWTVDPDAKTGHSITSDDTSDEVFDSSPDCDETPENDNCLKPGEKFSHTFEVPGAYPYHDRADPTNKGEVIVLELATTTTPAPTTTAAPPPPTEAPTTTEAATTTTEAASTTTSTSSTTTTTLVTATTNDSSDVGVSDSGGDDSNAPLLAGAAVVVAGLAGVAWWAYNRGGPPPAGPGGPVTGQGPVVGPPGEPPPTQMGPQI